MQIPELNKAERKIDDLKRIVSDGSLEAVIPVGVSDFLFT